ncbi:MAG: 3-dehydroquinate synthase [Candidatus Ratteibacteria bacterium]|jgi:3-dehydroquinate synthase
MQTFILQLPEKKRTVPIFTRINASSFIQHTLPSLFPGEKILFVLDKPMATLYPSLIPETIGNKRTFRFFLAPGERNKTLSSVGKIITECAHKQFERIDAIAAVGGGKSSDLAGFAASIYQRGIPFFIIPTTLLSMVDACVGGKTAVNLPEGKNLAGTFYQPTAVAMDFSFLDTLPKRQIRTGMAEVIKHAVIGLPSLFSFLETIKPYQKEHYPRFIEESIQFKKHIVESDEKEGGIREILNFGHTMGHAVEIHHYARFSHGEAVALGMEWESFLGEKIGITPIEVREKISAMLIKYNFPRNKSSLHIEQIISSLKRDKKNRHGKIRMVLPTAIGAAQPGYEIDSSLIHSTWKEFCDEK